MKTIKKIVPVFACLMLFFTACHKNKIEQTKHIPKDATFVLSINVKNYVDKMKDHKEQIDSLLQFLSTKIFDSDSVKLRGGLVKDAFDLQQPVFFYAQYKSSIAAGASTSGALIAGIKDKDKLETLLKSNAQSTSIQQGKDFSYTVNEKIAVGWNKDIVIFMPADGVYGDTASLAASLKSLFGMKESESIADNPEFTKSFTTNADISYFSNATQSYSSFLQLFALSKAGDLLKDTYSAGTIDFNNGSIDFVSNTYPNSDLLAIIKKNEAEKISGKLAENFPGKPQAIADVSFNMKQLVAIFDFIGIDQMAQPFLQKWNLTLDDIAAAFKGEIAFVSSDFSMKKTDVGGAPYSTTLPNYKYVVCLPIADKKAYDKITAALTQAGVFVQQNGQAVPALIAENNAGGVSYFANDKYVLIASSAGLSDSFANAKAKATLPEDAAKNMSGKTSYFYVDLQSILSQIPAEGYDSANMILYKNTFKDVAAWGKPLNGKSIEGEAHLYFQDAKQNSLLTLVQLFKQMKANDKIAYNATVDSVSLDTNIPIPPGEGK